MTAALEMTSAKWLIGELRGHGLSVSREPGQEDFGWHLNFQSQSSSSTFVISFRPDNEQEGKTWIGIIERNCGSSLLYSADAHGESLHLQSRPFTKYCRALGNVEELRWHFRRDFDQGREELGASSP
jgi:hypothetical protein